VTRDLIARARAGDGKAFGELVAPFRHELQEHCYRMLGSLQDAEDALQETLMAAWQGLDGFRGHASIRTWLYRIATTRCLNALRAGRRRPRLDTPLLQLDLPEPTGSGEVAWLEPYPDILLPDLADEAPSPEARYETPESISLAFGATLQLLPRVNAPWSSCATSSASAPAR
jgi:RNA polymerase sigma factor (sigma-70 family)